MQLIVRGGMPEKYLQKFACGALFLLALDALWITGTKNAYLPYISTRSQPIIIMGYILYALLAGAIAASFTAPTLGGAASAGGLIGFLVFSVFNLTTFITNAKYPFWLASLDTLYGTIAWVLMFVVQSAVV